MLISWQSTMVWTKEQERANPADTKSRGPAEQTRNLPGRGAGKMLAPRTSLSLHFHQGWLLLPGCRRHRNGLLSLNQMPSPREAAGKGGMDGLDSALPNERGLVALLALGNGSLG